MIPGQIVIAYHGCDATTRDDLISGRMSHLSHSANKYDWLGPGAYFFESDMARALNFATASYENPEKLYTKNPIGTPAVVGAVLCLKNVLDMTTQAGIEEFSRTCKAAEVIFEATGETPINSPSSDEDVEIIHRAYDNAIFTYLHGLNQGPEYDAVRGAFVQGEKIEKSAFQRHTHIQLALRKNDCVLGWFLPPGAKLLTSTEYDEAKARLAQQRAIRTARKPRKRLSPPASS